MGEIGVFAPDGVPEIRTGDDLVEMLVPLVELADGDIVVVTSKAVRVSAWVVSAQSTKAKNAKTAQTTGMPPGILNFDAACRCGRRRRKAM